MSPVLCTWTIISVQVVAMVFCPAVQPCLPKVRRQPTRHIGSLCNILVQAILMTRLKPAVNLPLGIKGRKHGWLPNNDWRRRRSKREKSKKNNNKQKKWRRRRERNKLNSIQCPRKHSFKDKICNLGKWIKHEDGCSSSSSNKYNWLFLLLQGSTCDSDWGYCRCQ